MLKIYNYIFYRTYLNISKTNSWSPKINAVHVFSFSLLLNLFSIYFFLFKSFNQNIFNAFVIVGVIIGIINLRYFTAQYITELDAAYKKEAVESKWKYLVDFYPDLSLLLVLKSVTCDATIMLTTLGVLVILRLVYYFSLL